METLKKSEKAAPVLMTINENGINKQIDLTPLEGIISFGGLELLVDTLREVLYFYNIAAFDYPDFTEMMGEKSFAQHQFYMQHLADEFDKVLRKSLAQGSQVTAQ